MFTLFLTFYAGKGGRAARASDADVARAAEIVKSIPDLRRGLLFTPEAAADPFVEYPPPPQLALQLYFDTIAALEAAASARGPLQALAALASVDMSDASQQAKLLRA
jgi:hypothetical protein